MRCRTALAVVSFFCATIIGGPVQARFYWDGRPVFSTLETWELIFYGAAALALASLIIYIPVKLINRFFGKR